jgi:hypothetical protein
VLVLLAVLDGGQVESAGLVEPGEQALGVEQVRRKTGRVGCSLGVVSAIVPKFWSG